MRRTLPTHLRTDSVSPREEVDTDCIKTLLLAVQEGTQDDSALGQTETGLEKPKSLSRGGA